MDPISLAVQVLTELVSTLRERQSPNGLASPLAPAKRVAIQAYIAATLVEAVPGVSGVAAGLIARMVMDALVANPRLLENPKRITADVFAQEQDDTLTSFATLSKPTKPIFSRSARNTIAALMLSVAGSGVYDVGKAVITVAASAGQEEQQIVMVVTGDNVNVRLSPSLQGQIINSLNSGTHVFLLSEDADWSCVRVVKNGKEQVGWISKQYLQRA